MYSEIDPVRIGIQKHGGHMHEASVQVLREFWGINLAPARDGKGSDLCDITIELPARLNKSGGLILPAHAPIPAKLFKGRIGDIAPDIHDGFIDMGIVTTDILAEWQASQANTLRRHTDVLPYADDVIFQREAINKKTLIGRSDIKIDDVGHAGTRLMIGVAESFVNKHQNSENIWLDAIKYSQENDLPIFTTFEMDLRDFLLGKIEKMPRIECRQGTIEARARMSGGIVIADLVESGNSMRRNGFIPIQQICESRVLIISRNDAVGPKREAIRAMQNCIKLAA